jgi:hypothetical protein
MFRILDIGSNEFRTSLDCPTREELESIFRAPGREGRLLCPHCREKVIFRYSDIYRPHFAHKALGGCPYSSESMEMLQARAALYLFLKKHFGTNVQIERVLPIDGMPRAVDCWVQREEKPLTYWLMEKGMRGTQRLDDLRQNITGTGAAVQFVFLAQVLREVENEKDVYQLTPTEEHLKLRSKYDNIYSDYGYGGGSLHYLKVQEQRAEVTTLRSLWHKGCGRHFSAHYRLHTEMAKLIIDAESGEFVHPGEDALLSEHLREAALMERQRQASRRKPWLEALARMRACDTQTADIPRESHQEESATPLLDDLEDRAGPCERCGTVTTDWMSFDDKTGRCKCNNCFQPNRQKTIEADDRSVNKLRKGHAA